LVCVKGDVKTFSLSRDYALDMVMPLIQAALDCIVHYKFMYLCNTI